MKTLYLLRHAKSSWDDPELADHDRPLAPRGTRAAAIMGRYMIANGMMPDFVLCSTARRAVDTLAIVLKRYGREIPVSYERGLYLTGRRALLDRMRNVSDDAGSVLLVAHNPDLQDLALSLAETGDAKTMQALKAKFPTAGLAVLACPIDTWQGLAERTARLERFVPPKTLDMSAA